MNNTLITQDRLDEIVRLAGIAPVSGLFAEVGVYKGGSLKELANAFPDREIWGFDTFEGLPKAHWNDSEHHEPGEFSDTSLQAVREFLHDNKNVKLIPGFFPESVPVTDLPLDFSFVHIDTDFYLSVKACLNYFWNQLLPGGVMVFDDYEWPNCPGVKQALLEFGQPIGRTNAAYQAYLIKPNDSNF